jgi:hypothetical protein
MESNYIKHKDMIKEYQKKNKDALIKYSRNYYKLNREKFRLYYENYKKKKSLNSSDNIKNKYIEAIEKENIKIQKLKDKAEQYKLLLQEQGYNVNL